MSVYIDPMIDHGKRIGRAGPLWCHMIADTLSELHDMAARIGLRASWFQSGSAPHYDIGTSAKRAQAVAAGAVECDRHQFVAHLRRIRGISHAFDCEDGHDFGARGRCRRCYAYR